MSMIPLAMRKIGAWTVKSYPLLGQTFVDLERRVFGLGDDTLNPIEALTTDAHQTVTNKTISGKTNSITGFPAVGTILVTVGANAPTGGCLECAGVPLAVSRVTYSELFHLIGETFGPGDGFTTFNIPARTIVAAADGATVWIKAKE
jgi:hypothetical protein